MSNKSRFLRVPVEPFTVESGASADDVLTRMERISFQGRSLATARRIWEKMLADDCTIFLGMAGALSAGGLRLVVAHLLVRAVCEEHVGGALGDHPHLAAMFEVFVERAHHLPLRGEGDLTDAREPAAA